MKLLLAKDIISLTDFARQTRKHTVALKRTNRPRVLTHNGKAAAVVLSVAAYESLTLAADEHRLDMELKAAIESYAKGRRGTPGKLAFDQLRARASGRRSPK